MFKPRSHDRPVLTLDEKLDRDLDREGPRTSRPQRRDQLNESVTAPHFCASCTTYGGCVCECSDCDATGWTVAAGRCPVCRAAYLEKVESEQLESLRLAECAELQCAMEGL